MKFEDTALSEIDQKFLTFALDEEEYGVPVMQVVGIVKIEELIPVPHTEPYFLGLMDVRGRVMPVVDLKIKLDLDLGTKHQGERAIIIDVHGNRVALMVDAVNHVQIFPPETVDPGPPSIQDGSGRFILGVGKQENNFVVLINLERLFEDEELARMCSTGTANA